MDPGVTVVSPSQTPASPPHRQPQSPPSPQIPQARNPVLCHPTGHDTNKMLQLRVHIYAQPRQRHSADYGDSAHIFHKLLQLYFHKRAFYFSIPSASLCYVELRLRITVTVHSNYGITNYGDSAFYFSELLRFLGSIRFIPLLTIIRPNFR